jgi:hypothetical protein
MGKIFGFTGREILKKYSFEEFGVCKRRELWNQDVIYKIY